MAKRGPGKFDSDLDAALYEMSTEGPDAEAGSSSEPPYLWAGLLKQGVDLARAIKSVHDSGEAGYEGVDAEDLTFLRTKAKGGVIITENDQGFVEVVYYDTNDKLWKDWEELVKELEQDPDEEFEDNRGRRRNGEENILRDETIEPFLKGKGPVFRIQTWETGKTDRAHGRNSPFLGHRITMTEPGGQSEVVFEGEDYSPSPMIEADSDRTLDDIVAFFVNDYEDESRTPRQRAVVKKYGDILGGEASALFGEDSEREENPRQLDMRPGTIHRLVHPDGDEHVTIVDRDPDDFLVAPGFKKGPLVVVRLDTGADRGQVGPVNVSDLKPLQSRRPTQRPNGQAAWLVLLNGEQTDIVYFAEDMDADDVKRSLVNHDGYDPRITVKKRERRRTHAPDARVSNRTRAR